MKSRSVQCLRSAAATAIALSLSLVPVSSDGATTCTDICGSSNPCSISATKTVTPDSTVDCTGRAVIVTATGNVKVTDGFFTLLADSITVNDGGNIRAVQSASGGSIGFTLKTSGTVGIAGALKAQGDDGGGRIVVEAGGDITIYDTGTLGIAVDGTASDADGGEIILRSDEDVVIYHPITAEGGSAGYTDGGTIEIHAAGDVTTGYGGLLRVSGKQSEAGTIRVSAGNDIAIYADVEAEGKGNEGNGGNVEISAKNAIDVGSVATLSVRGGVNATGGASYGGSIELEAGCGGVNFDGDVDTSGGEAGSGIDGGALIIDTIGDVTIGGTSEIVTSARDNGGSGGNVIVRSLGDVVVENGASIEADGDTANNEEGAGATIVIEGCTLDVQGGASITATGYDGGVIALSTGKVGTTGAAQPMTIGESATLSVGGDEDGDEGEITLAPRRALLGECSNDDTIECVLDTDCTVGCETGNCLYAYPDTGGVTTQFDVEPEYEDATSLAPCPVECQ